MPEEEIDAAEVVHQPAEVLPVGQLLVNRTGALRVRAGKDPVALAVGDDRSLEEHVRRRLAVVQPFCELERTLDVLARGLEITTPAVAAGTPREDVRAEVIRRQLAAFGKDHRLVEQVDRGLDARKLVARNSESVEDVCALEIGELGTFREIARTSE